MKDTKRFEIDVEVIDVEIFGSTEKYTVRRLLTLRSWLGTLGYTSKSLGRFDSREEARKFIEKIRDLPEYL